MTAAEVPRAGEAIEPVTQETDPVRVLRFGAATHNAHRIHYDKAYAIHEGLDDCVLMAQLHGALFFRAAARFAGDPDAVDSIGWQNRAPAFVGAELTVTGAVRGVEAGSVTLHLEEHTDDGTLCAVGTSVVAVKANRVC